MAHDTRDATSDPAAPNTAGRRRRRIRIRRTLASAAAVLVVTGLFLVVTSFTGFPGPGPLRRYRTSELQDLVDRINADPSCNGPGNVASDHGSARPAASVDRLRSRVHLAHPWTVLLSPADAALVEGRSDEPDRPHSSPATGCAPYRTSPAMP